MMPLRPELLELTPQALTALSNAGFVKRAQKELDNGNIPALEQDEAGTLTAVFRDGTRTRLEKIGHSKSLAVPAALAACAAIA